MIMRKLVLSCLIFVLLPSFALSSGEDERITALQREIEEKGYHFTVGTTSVSHLSEAERAKITGYVPLTVQQWEKIPRFRPTDQDVGDPLFDWRGLGGVTPVKNQQACGSCWAFVAVAQLESFVKIYDGVELDLSEQQVVDCNTYGYDCDGGNHVAAYDLFRYEGAVREDCIPYSASDGNPCTQDLCVDLATINGYESITFMEQDITAIKQALQRGPVVTVVRTHPYFYDYISGCYDHDSLLEPDHALLIVGWDDAACGGEGAWICKNSWGTGWGMNGYCYIKYGVSSIGLWSAAMNYPPMVDVTYPDGGEALHAGDICVISWSTGNVEPDSVSIHLSTNGGASYDEKLAGGITGAGSHVWRVPDPDVAEARIRVTAYLDDEVRGTDESDGNFSMTFADVIRQNYPNPFNETTSISYSLAEAGRVRIEVFDISGHRIKLLRDIDHEPGSYAVDWDGTDAEGNEVASGTYFCRIEAGPLTETKKIVLIR